MQSANVSSKERFSRMNVGNTTCQKWTFKTDNHQLLDMCHRQYLIIYTEKCDKMLTVLQYKQIMKIHQKTVSTQSINQSIKSNLYAAVCRMQIKGILTYRNLIYHSVARQCLHSCKIDQPTMEIVKFRGVRTPKSINRLTKNLAWVITSAMTPRTPKFKTIPPLRAWQRMREISPSCGF